MDKKKYSTNDNKLLSYAIAIVAIIAIGYIFLNCLNGLAAFGLIKLGLTVFFAYMGVATFTAAANGKLSEIDEAYTKRYGVNRKRHYVPYIEDSDIVLWTSIVVFVSVLLWWLAKSTSLETGMFFGAALAVGIVWLGYYAGSALGLKIKTSICWLWVVALFSFLTRHDIYFTTGVIIYICIMIALGGVALYLNSKKFEENARPKKTRRREDDEDEDGYLHDDDDDDYDDV